ncbi:helix-turn-helix transcriptional regulator [Staphylococcus casei]|uniref:Helix-turn-helix transcriptional regulator n=1 Tax=Staphylococcus casei TaxID=201828 RepID=A0ABZ2WAJ7_9STAP
MRIDKYVYRRSLIRKGMLQLDLAIQIGVTPEYLSKVVNGNLKLSLNMAIKISEALEIEMSELTALEPVKN